MLVLPHITLTFLATVTHIYLPNADVLEKDAWLRPAGEGLCEGIFVIHLFAQGNALGGTVLYAVSGLLFRMARTLSPRRAD